MRGDGNAGSAKLLGDQEAVLLVADDDGRGEAEPRRRGRASAVSWSSVLAEISGQSCLGKLSRETGQSRVPEPPERMTGTMGDSVLMRRHFAR